MNPLPDAEAFKRLADGSARGLGPAMARLALAGLAAPYGLAVRARNVAYDRGWLAARRAPIPVICIGNLTLGGTGKTPLVRWLAGLFLEQSLRPAIVSRGYGAARGERGDEAAEMALLLPEVLHVSDRDRVAGAVAAAAAGARIVVLDDGFQHRRLARDLDIVAIDATDPWGCGHLFPRGLLREPLSGLRRADAVVLTRADSVDERRRQEIRSRVESLRQGGRTLAWAEAAHRPVRLLGAGGEPRPLDSLRSSRVAAFAGIGNPAAFRATLAAVGAEVVGFRPFPDHHRYTPGELDGLAAWAADRRAEMLVTTVKDLVKCGAAGPAAMPLAALEVALELLSGAAGIEGLVAPVAARAAAGHAT